MVMVMICKRMIPPPPPPHQGHQHQRVLLEKKNCGGVVSLTLRQGDLAVSPMPLYNRLLLPSFPYLYSKTFFGSVLAQEKQTTLKS
jgi:hypothetical protein